MNEGKLQDQARRANSAKRILEDDIFKDAIAKIRAGIEKNFRDCDAKDPERLMRIKMMDDVLRLFITHFESAVKKGQIASDNLVNLEKERKWRNKLKIKR